MSNMQFYCQGIESATITATLDGGATIDPLYPKDNLKLRSRRTKVQTLNGATLMTEINFVFDFGTYTTVDYLYIDKSNLLAIAETQSIVFNYWNGTSWIDTGYDDASTITDSPSVDTFTQRSATKYQLVITFDIEPSVEFWMNFVLMGEMIEFDTFAPDFGTVDKRKDLGLVIHEAIDGNKSRVRVTQVSSSVYRGVFERTFKTLTSTEFDKIDRIYTDTSEKLYPFSMTDSDGTLRFVSLLTNRFRERMRSNIYNSTTLIIEDEL